MAERFEDTVAYYNRNAAHFAADTAGLDMSVLYERFLHHIPPGGRILDAGCGVGRDALAFVDRGYSVVGFDASVEMVRLARKRVVGRAVVLQMHFDELSRHAEFHGIWACASLLHVPSAELPDVIQRLAAALRPGGTLYMSFKYGSGERVAGGRRFTDLDEASLHAAVARAGLSIFDVWTTNDVRPGRMAEAWLNAFCTKLPHAEPKNPNVGVAAN